MPIPLAISAVIDALPKVIETGSEIWKFVQAWKKNLSDKGLWTEEIEAAVAARYDEEAKKPERQPRND